MRAGDRTPDLVVFATALPPAELALVRYICKIVMITVEVTEVYTNELKLPVNSPCFTTYVNCVSRSAYRKRLLSIFVHERERFMTRILLCPKTVV